MKSAQVIQYGGQENIQIREIDTPPIGDGQVLVEVHASSLNPFDSKVLTGEFKDALPEPPFTLGGDIAGVVTAYSKDVTGLQVGDRVYGQAHVIAGNSGACAEYAAVSSAQVAKMPEGLGFAEAASLVLVGVSALQGLSEHITLQPGSKLFVHGGAGGIGSLAIQIAKAKGAYVATTATGEGSTLVTRLGADRVIDYASQDFSSELHEFDAVFDTVGGDDFVKSYKILGSGGVAVSMVAATDEARAAQAHVQSFTQSTKVTTEQLQRLSKLIEDSVVSARIGKTYALDDIVEAFTAREASPHIGKIVITIR